MTTEMMTRKELMDHELDAVNGGFGWNDIVNVSKHMSEGAKILVKSGDTNVLYTVLDIVDDTIKAIKNLDTPVEPYKMPKNPIEM